MASGDVISSYIPILLFLLLTLNVMTNTPTHDEIYGSFSTNDVPHPGRKFGRVRTRKQPLKQQMIFNTSAHEVPSGPNPISNR